MTSPRPDVPVTEDSQPGQLPLAERLSALGGESTTEQSVKRIIPWVVSVMIHVGIIALGFLVTWTVALIQQPEEPTLIVADFRAPRYEPIQAPEIQSEAVDEPFPADSMDFDALVPELPSEQAPAPQFDQSTIAPPRMRGVSRGDFSSGINTATATFVGLTSSNAQRIVYVIDASGSMIASLQFIVRELERSLNGLSREQEFGIVFFQGNDAVSVPPASRMSQATETNREAALQWIRKEIIPRGRSNPLKAIEHALRLKSDAIFLLSTNITGSGEFEIDQQDLLQMLEEMNPINERSGTRLTQINCIQFLDPDPLDTLLNIARLHGGTKGYKFSDRSELGLDQP